MALGRIAQLIQWALGWTARVPFQVEARYFDLFNRVQNGSGAQNSPFIDNINELLNRLNQN
jgi:hypothetical protein